MKRRGEVNTGESLCDRMQTLCSQILADQQEESLFYRHTYVRMPDMHLLRSRESRPRNPGAFWRGRYTHATAECGLYTGSTTVNPTSHPKKR